ncbi:ARMS [Mytilus edulis]|uniref:KIDINS220 n=1 Tax=Mytilus edulis TaxID=6550 RepID=A0A8S3SL47_MYTED|nr:ARMS [Mytilus edulis]
MSVVLFQVSGWTALMLAARGGHVEVSRLLLENKCNKDITNVSGWTALMMAAIWGHVEVSRLLLENRCNKDITDDDGWTALMWAARGGHVEVSRLLLENRCNKDITNRDGRTALHLAAECGHLQTTRYLVEEGGISPFVKTHEGKTPYDLAATGEFGPNKEVMEYLQTVMSEKSSGVTAGLGIEDSIRSAMLNKLLGSGSYESFDMRCMVTGQFSVGKSSLVKLLVGDNVPEGRHATDGITLIEGRCGLDIETRNWIMIDPATYNALDVVYNKVLMTSIEEDESKQAKTPENQEPDAKPVDSQHAEDNPSQKSQATKSTSWPVNDSSEPSTQPQTAQSLSPQTSSSESKKQQMKKKMTTKMTKKEIRKRMEKVLKSGKYKMKVGRLIFWDFGGQYVYYTTHQTFMTYRALFLVVFDGSKRLNEEVPDVLCFPGQHMTPTPAVFLLHWVNSILTYCKVVYAGIPRILFVATHKDKIPVEDVETRRALLYSEVEELFRDHEGRNHLVLDKQIFVNATDKNDQEIESLKAITELTFDHPYEGFWPKKRRIQETFRRMSESGIIHREDLYQIWKQKDFRAVLPYKEFIFNILIHLDILAEQRRYDTASGSRLPVEMFFVPCMVTQRNTTSFMDKECTPVRAICLAFVFKGTVIPPALPNRLISACLSMWTLKQYEGRKLLFSGFIVVSFDKSHDIVVCVEGNKILLYIVHKTSAGLIVRDIATVVKECLVTTLERISDFYQSTIHVKRCQQLPFHLEYSCSEMKCFIDEEEALQSNEWVCDTHNITHRAGNSTVWNQEKNILRFSGDFPCLRELSVCPIKRVCIESLIEPVMRERRLLKGRLYNPLCVSDVQSLIDRCIIR